MWNHHGEAFEAELAFRGIDIREADDPNSNLTLRRLWVIYKHLPADNAVDVEISNLTPEERLFGIYGHMLANIYDAIQRNTWVSIAMNTPKGRPLPAEPKPHPRPNGQDESKIHQTKEIEDAKDRDVDWFPGRTYIDKGVAK